MPIRSARSPAACRGMTLVELLSAMTVMVIVTGVVAGLSTAVLVSNDHNRGVAAAMQHGRVALDRITRAVSEAYATEADPGVVVVEASSGTSKFPDMLVVWKPEGTPFNPAGPPLVKELVIFCTYPSAANKLVEVRAPQDNRAVSLESLNTAAWRAALETLVASSSSSVVELTPLLRTAQVNGTRGGVRFERRIAPTLAAVAQVRSGAAAWTDLAWPQGIYSPSAGLRQVWVRMELQLMPGATSSNSGAGEPLPLFGSAAVYYELKK